MKLNPYPKYKKTDIDYFDKIPLHWNILPNRAIFEERNTKNTTNEALLSVTIRQGVIKQKELLENSSKKDSSNMDKSIYKLVLEGDLSYNKMRMWQGAVGVSKYRGIVSPAYIVLKSRRNAYSDYFHFLFRTPTYIKELHRYSYGICDDQLSLRFKDFKLIKSVLPPLEEQKNISAFIYAKENKIKKFIQNKLRLIKLLKEQKQAIINQAVTRGINSNVKMKPSGVEWLGDIPENWKIFQLKRIAKFNPSKSELFSSTVVSDIAVFLPMEAVSVDGKINCKEKRKVSEIWNGFSYFKKGDVVVAKITPCFENGKGAHLDFLATNFGFGTTEFVVIRPSKKICGGFLYFITMTSRFRKNGEEAMTGAAGQKRVPTDFMKSYIVALPNIEEQLEILNFIKQKNNEIDRTIKKTKTEIELIQEYRTRLISDVVTGKLDVRNINVDNILDEEIIDGLSINEETQDLNNSIKEVSNEY